jgi:LPS-assembly lipoprotein
MKKLLYTLFLLSTVTLLSACGFQLRGSSAVELPPQLQTLLLQSRSGNSDILQLARRSLRSNGITLVEDNNIANEENEEELSEEIGVYRLNIGNEQLAERVISVNSNARAGEYELSMTVPFQLISNEGDRVESDTLVVERIYLADPENAVAKAEEAELIKDEMRQALVVQLLRRLQNINFEAEL